MLPDGEIAKGEARHVSQSHISQRRKAKICHPVSRRFYKGVQFHGNKFKAAIWNGEQMEYLGLFFSPVDAAIAYDAAARRIYGDRAVTNFEIGEQPKSKYIVVSGHV